MPEGPKLYLGSTRHVSGLASGAKKYYFEMTRSAASAFLLPSPPLPVVAYQDLALIYLIYLSYGQFCGLNTTALPVGILSSV